MKRYILYYKFGSLKFFQRVFCYSPEDCHNILNDVSCVEYRIFDVFKGEFLEYVENGVDVLKSRK